MLKTSRSLMVVLCAMSISIMGYAQSPASPIGSSTPQPDSSKQNPSDNANSQLLQQQIKTLEDKMAQQVQNAKEVHKLKEQVKDLSEELNELIDNNKDTNKILSVYGFFDVGFSKLWAPVEIHEEDLRRSEPAFVFGNLNLYFDSTLSSSWRFLAEARLLLNPIGDTATYEDPLNGTPYQRVNVTSHDLTNYGAEFDYGSIEIERAHISFTRWEWLQITTGLFLTPFGIWNVDHGSPTRIMAKAPFLYSSHVGAFPPERQLGLLFQGKAFTRSIQLGYALTLTNGRGPAATLTDWDRDKAIGGRLEAIGLGKWQWQAGVSFYTGDYTDYKEVLSYTPVLEMYREITTHYRETALGADIRLEVGPYTFLGEVIANWRNYDDAHRPLITPEEPSSGYAPDNMRWGTYGLFAYRLPWQAFVVRPFISVGWINEDDTRREDNVVEITAGINWQITNRIVLKAEYHLMYWPDNPPEEHLNNLSESLLLMHDLVTQLAVAF